MSDAGIDFINDLLTENSTFVKYVSLPDKIKQAISCFDNMSIVVAIPMTWESGGLRMVDFNKYVTAQKTNWIKRLLENKSTIPFHHMSQFLPNINFETFLKCSVDPDKLSSHTPDFY